MAHAVAPWSRYTDPKTQEVNLTAEASELGFRPGITPRVIVVDSIIVSGFTPITSNGETVGWTVTLNGITYTIFND